MFFIIFFEWFMSTFLILFHWIRLSLVIFFLLTHNNITFVMVVTFFLHFG